MSVVMPALATSTSTGPCASSICANAASTAAGSVMSHAHVEGALGRAAAAVGDGDLVALGEERLGDGAADAAVAAGDEDGSGVCWSLTVIDASDYRCGRPKRGITRPRAGSRPSSDLEVLDAAVLDLAADLGDLEPVEVAQGLAARSMPLRTAWSMPSGEVPTISVTR